MEVDIGIQKYKDYLEKSNLSKNTIYQYLKYLKAYVVEYGLPNEEEFEVSKNIENIQFKKDKIKAENASTKAQTLKAVVSYRKHLKLPVEKIVTLYNDVNKQAKIRAEEKKREDNDDIMSLREYNKKVDDLYDENDVEKLRAYLINKIISLTNTRNMDLVARLITPKEYEMIYKDKKDENYLFLENNKLHFIRNKYKTSNTYGRKINQVVELGKTNKINTSFRLLKRNDDMLIPKDKLANISRYVTRLTFDLGETKIMKMMLREKNTLADASKMGENRGTALETLQSNYNISQY